MLLRLISCLIGIVVVSGCASTYKPDANVLKLQQSMNRQNAEKILQGSLSNNPQSTGICETQGIGFQTDEKAKISLASGIIHIKDAYVRGNEVERTSTYVVYEKNYVDRELRIADLTKIRIQLEGDTHFCGKTKGTNILQAFLSPLKWFAFDVRTEDMDKVIAAVTVLKPDIDLITGMGF